MKATVNKSGYVVMVDTVCGGPTILHKQSSGENANIMHPELYASETDAWKDIAEDIIENLQLFINGDKELEDTDFGTELYTAYCELFNDDAIVITIPEDPSFRIETSVQDLNS